MANTDVAKKVIYIGIWLEDVFTDEVIKNIASSPAMAKGKKLKATLNKSGLKLIKSRFFQDDKVQTFPITEIKTVTKNPEMSLCVMFILADPVKKYKIIALRCASDADASHFASVFSELRKDVHSGNIELKKRDNGNWTLRSRSAHNASQHLTELFNERKQANGDVIVKPMAETVYVPVLDRSKTQPNGNHHKGVYVKRVAGNSANNNYNISQDDDDDYVIETEVSSHPYTTPIPSSYEKYMEEYEARDKIDALASEKRDGLTRRNTGSSKDPHHPSTYTHRVVYSQNSGPTALPSRPVLYTSNSYQAVPSPSYNYHTPAATYEAKRATIPISPTYTNPWVSHKRASQSSMLPSRHYVPGPGSIVSGNRVKFDQVSIRSNTSKVSRSLRASDYSIPTTIRRSIENTYPRPMILRRTGVGQIIQSRPRPVTYHPMGIHDRRVYQVDETSVVL